MGAKTWMLVHATTKAREALAMEPTLDREATWRWTTRLFPGVKLTEIGDGDLSYTSPPDDEIHAGCFGDVSVIAASEIGIDYPSRLSPSLLNPKGTTYLHAMHSVVDWFAFAVWIDGKLQRSLSLSPDTGILEDIGARMSFEEPYWSGKHPVLDLDDIEADYPFPFHPLDLGEAALAEFFGYQLEGEIDDSLLDAESIPLVRFKRSRSWWKFWI